jgi:hypothetical protein
VLIAKFGEVEVCESVLTRDGTTVRWHGPLRPPLWLDTDKAIIDAAIVGVTKHHLVDAAAALDLELTDDEVTALEEPYVLRQATWF